MSTDTKLGMVVGLGIVIAVAVTYYPKGTPPKTGRTGSVMPSLPSPATAAPHAPRNG
jgi:hypothetical protein